MSIWITPTTAPPLIAPQFNVDARDDAAAAIDGTDSRGTMGIRPVSPSLGPWFMLQ
jgi:hypothetical protein